MDNPFAKWRCQEEAPLPRKRADETRVEKKPAKKAKALSERAGPGTDTDSSVLIERWQSAATGAQPDLRRFIVLAGVLLSPQTVSGTACKALAALRDAARDAGHHDLTPAFLLSLDVEAIADIITMVNFRNNKAKALRDVARTVKMARGRVATTLQGYVSYRGIGKELAALLLLVNTTDLAARWCDNENTST